MNLTFTPKQLNGNILAGILNQAFIKSNIIQSDADIDNISFSMNDMQCKMSILGNTLQLSHVIRIERSASQESVLKIVDHINCKIIHAKYAGTCGDGSHLIAHHYAHWIPEDETIAAAYIVKLARSFIGFQEKHLSHWESLTQRVLC